MPAWAPRRQSCGGMLLLLAKRPRRSVMVLSLPGCRAVSFAARESVLASRRVASQSALRVKSVGVFEFGWVPVHAAIVSPSRRSGNQRPAFVRSQSLREVRERMDGRTASVAVARVQSVRVSRGAGSPSALAMFNPTRADHRRLAAVDGNPFPKAPLARIVGPGRALPPTPDGPESGSASPGQFGCRRTTSIAMKVRHGQQQQDAHRCDAPGGNPGRHGPRV